MAKKAAKLPAKVPVTKRALIQRMNRALAKGGEELRTNRNPTGDLGKYLIVDTDETRPSMVKGEYWDPGLVKLARAMGVLKPYEEVSE